VSLAAARHTIDGKEIWMRSLFLGVLLLALSVPAFAGSKVQMSIVPTPPDCHNTTSVCLNSGVACSAALGNAQCAAATLLSSSKFSLDGKLKLKGAVKKVRDHLGALVTTGPEGSDDNYIFRLRLKRCVPDKGTPVCNETDSIYVKVALIGGNGKFAADLAEVLGALSPQSQPGDGVTISSAVLMTPPAPGACAGVNSAADVIARLDLVGCDGAGTLGAGGLMLQ
jgi:hypothetical protein